MGVHERTSMKEHLVSLVRSVSLSTVRSSFSNANLQFVVTKHLSVSNACLSLIHLLFLNACLSLVLGSFGSEYLPFVGSLLNQIRFERLPFSDTELAQRGIAL